MLGIQLGGAAGPAHFMRNSVYLRILKLKYLKRRAVSTHSSAQRGQSVSAPPMY